MKLTSPQLQELIGEYSSLLPGGAKERIIVDESGGLAYPLFGSYFSNHGFSLENSLNISPEDSRREMNELKRYIDAVLYYVDDAEQYARDHGFDLLYISATKKLIFSNLDFNKASPYRLGVGKKPVTSARRVKQFCKMIRSGHDRFEDRYSRIRELAKQLKSYKHFLQTPVTSI